MPTQGGSPLPNDTVVLAERDIVVHALQIGMSRGQMGLDDVPGLVKRVIHERAWQERRVHQTRETARFATFTDFLQAHMPEGLHSSLSALKRLCANDPEVLDLLDQVTVGTHGGDRKSDEAKTAIKGVIHSLDNKRDRSGQHLRRLRKGFPKLYQQVLDKKLSVTEAAIKAGIYPKRIAISLTSATSAAQSILNNTSAQYVNDLITALQHGGHDE